MTEFWGQKTYCLVTGASRGFGREICIQFAKNFGDGSVFLLLARGEKGLNDTENLMKAGSTEVNFKVIKRTMDLEHCEPENFVDIIASSLAESDNKASQFDHVVLVHNAGCLGDISKHVTQYENEKELQNYYKFNVFNFITLNSKFLKCFADKECRRRTVINVSSLAAIAPIKGCGFYCSGKAARESLMKVLALENPSVKTLSYAPGPMDTEMVNEIKKYSLPDTKEAFKNLKLLTCEQSVNKLVKFLGDDKFKSGDRVDYYDI